MQMHGSGTKLAMFLDFNIRLAYAIGLSTKDKALEQDFRKDLSTKE
jgi:hypothetical protein